MIKWSESKRGRASEVPQDRGEGYRRRLHEPVNHRYDGPITNDTDERVYGPRADAPMEEMEGEQCVRVSRGVGGGDIPYR